MQKKLFFLGGLLVGAGLFAYLVYRTGVSDVWQSLMLFGIVPLVAFISISLLNFCLYSLRWKIILNAMVPPEKRVPFHRMFLHRMSGFATGYLTPAAQVAGEPLRVAMLVQDGVPAKVATGSVVLDLAFEIGTFVFYVAAGITFAVSTGIAPGGSLVGPIILVSVILAVMVGFFISTITGSGFFHRFFSITRLNKFTRIAAFEEWLKEMEELMSKFFVGRPWIIIIVVVLSFMMATFKAVEAIFISHFLGQNIGITDALLLSTLPGVSLLLPVPGGLGVFEGSNAALFALLHLTINPLAYTVIIRLRDFVFIGIGIAHAVSSGEKFLGKYGQRS